MIISVRSGSSGWGKYVTEGTAQKPRDQSQIEMIDGDIELGDYLSKQNKYEDSYYTFVLGFEGKPDREKIQSMYDDFKKEMFVGLKEDEYHIDGIIHYDTDDTHIHCRVPKQNLKTNTHLQLYYDKIDRPRKELIQDYISLKHGENIAREQNREVHKEEKEEVINQWRSERDNEPFNFSKKADKQLAEAEINKYIIELHNAQLIDNINDIKEVLEKSLGVKVERFGTDLKKDFSYVTISDENGKKLRIKGEIYNDQFYENTRADREKQIRDNKRDFGNTESSEVRLKQVQTKLRNANEKRYSRVTELFAAARTRADERLSTIVQNIENKIPINNSKSISSDRDNDRDNDRQFPKQQSKANDNQPRAEHPTIIEKTKVNKNEQSIRTAITDTAREIEEERIRTINNNRNSTRELQKRIRADIISTQNKHESNARRIQESIREHIDEQQRIKSENNTESIKAMEQAETIARTIEPRQRAITELTNKSRWYSKFTDKFREVGNKIDTAREQIVDYIKTKFNDVSKSFYNQAHHKKEIAQDFREYNLKKQTQDLTRTDVNNAIDKHNDNLQHSNMKEAMEKTREQSYDRGYSR